MTRLNPLVSNRFAGLPARLALLLLVCLGAGCSSVGLKQQPLKTIDGASAVSRLTSKSLSEMTRAVLQSDAMAGVAPADRNAWIQKQATEDPIGLGGLGGSDEPGDPWRVAAAELLFGEAEDLGGQDASLYLASAQQSDLAIRHGVKQFKEEEPTEAFAFALALNRRAIARFIETSSMDWLVGQEIIVKGRGGRFVVERDKTMDARLLKTQADRLIPAEGVVVQGMRDHHRRAGLGASVIAVRDQADAKPPRQEAFMPPEGVIVPATVTVAFAEDQQAVLKVWDTDKTDHLDIKGVSLPLSLDTTAPIAELFGRTDLERIGKDGLGNTPKYMHSIGIYMHEPYDAAKIPVVMVHGLWASPITWRDMLNELRADPVLRQKYQFWMFYYPTGLPIPRSAAYFRQHLQGVKNHFDPKRKHTGPRSMVVFGHSMGGLLTKAVVQSSGDKMWRSLHPDPFASVQMSDEVRNHLREVFFYEADPDIKRVVFFATPHRGSPMALSPIGLAGDASIRLPSQFEPVRLWFDKQGDAHDVSNAYQIKRGVPSSIDDLRPDAPHLNAYLQTPIRSGVKVHAVIGTGAGNSDGVVPIKSAELGIEDSALRIKSGHEAHMHPEAIDEAKRLLHEHLKALKSS